jgi:hypothetical protein
MEQIGKFFKSTTWHVIAVLSFVACFWWGVVVVSWSAIVVSVLGFFYAASTLVDKLIDDNA